MWAVFGMTPHVARRRVKISITRKDGSFKTAEEHEAEVAAKIDKHMKNGRCEQLSPIYGVNECAVRFAELAVAAGGGRVEIRARINDGTPVYDKKKKDYVQRFRWDTVMTFKDKTEKQAC